MSESLAKLRTFDRYVSRHDLMNDDTNTIVEKSRAKAMKLKKAMERLNSARGYEQAFENFKDAEEMEVIGKINLLLKHLMKILVTYYHWCTKLLMNKMMTILI